MEFGCGGAVLSSFSHSMVGSAQAMEMVGRHRRVSPLCGMEYNWDFRRL
jgi:hypothetical protein